MMNIRIAVVIFALMLSNICFADTFKSEADLKPYADGVMANVGKGDIKAAFGKMKPYVIIPEAEFQSAALVSQSQRDQFGARYGKTVGTEFVGMKKIGESLVRLTYIEKTEKHALPWIFYFYKSPEGWVLNSFHWNDKLTGLFSEEN